MTYQEVNDRLTRVQTALQSLQDGSYANQTSINVPQMTSQLQEVEAKLQEQLLVLSEAEKTAFVNGKPVEYRNDRELSRFKNNPDIYSIEKASGQKIKEQQGPQFNLDETKAIAREIGKAVAKGLKSMGDELATMKVKNIEEGSFDIHVQYKKDTSTDDFSFHISGDDLHLTDFSFDKVVGSVGVKPSGEPIVHVDVIANELVKHWKSQMKEGMSDDEFQQAQQNQRLEDHPEKDMIKKIQALIAKEKGIKEEEALEEAPEGKVYIKIPKSDYKKAIAVLDDVVDDEYVKTDIVDDDGAGNVIIYFNFTEAMTGHSHYNPDVDPAEFIYDLAMDLGANGIQIAQASHDIDESTEESPDGGDLDVGHQDDEPAMLKNKMYRAAKLANMLYDKLDAYDQMSQEVDFPDWWQTKLSQAKDMIQSCYDYLDGEEGMAEKDAENTQPNIAALALENANNINEIGMFNDPVGYEKSKPAKPTYTKKYVSKGVYDIFKHGKKVKTVKDGEGAANAWMNNARKGQKNEEVGGQDLSELKPGDKFEFNGKTFILVKHIEGSIAKVIRPNGDTSTVSFGGKVNTGKKAGIGPDAFGQGKGHHIDEDHSKNPNDKYVVRPCKNKKEPWAVWEGETRVKGFAEKKDAQAYADKQNKEQGLNEGESTCCGKCGRKHVKGTKCKTPYLKGKDHCRTR